MVTQDKKNYIDPPTSEIPLLQKRLYFTIHIYIHRNDGLLYPCLYSTDCLFSIMGYSSLMLFQNHHFKLN